MNTKVKLLLPIVCNSRNFSEWLDSEVEYKYSLQFNTEISFQYTKDIKDGCIDFWYLKLSILGFGIAINRQMLY